MSYLNRASAVALSAAGIAAILGMSQAAGHVVTQHRVTVTRYSEAAFKTATSTPALITHTGSARRHRLSSHHHRKRHNHHLGLPRDYAAWSKVADCEESGWYTPGGEYPDSVGINITNYEAFGGTPQPAGTPTIRQRVLQIEVADRLIRSYGIAVPDQSGCGGGW